MDQVCLQMCFRRVTRSAGWNLQTSSAQSGSDCIPPPKLRQVWSLAERTRVLFTRKELLRFWQATTGSFAFWKETLKPTQPEGAWFGDFELAVSQSPKFQVFGVRISVFAFWFEENCKDSQASGSWTFWHAKYQRGFRPWLWGLRCFRPT